MLVNSNPATIMTDPEMADRTYIEPLTWEIVDARSSSSERPDALLPTLGGQTGLNLAMDLAEHGVLEKYGVEMIGAKPRSSTRPRTASCSKQAMSRSAWTCRAAASSTRWPKRASDRREIGLPLRHPALASRWAAPAAASPTTEDEFERLVAAASTLSPVSEVLIEESIIGWKEFELEVMRDSDDNVVIICSIENFDPMGVHTGDSITVAPAQTLTDKEYQRMRDAVDGGHPRDRRRDRRLEHPVRHPSRQRPAWSSSR